MSETTIRTAGENPEVRVLQEKLEGKNRAFATLFRLFRKLRDTGNLDKAVELFAEVLSLRLGYERVTVYLHRPGAEVMEPYYSIGVDDDRLPDLYRVSPFIRWLKGRDDFSDVGNFEEMENGENPSRTAQETLIGKGYLHALPISEKGEVVGVILLGGGPDPGSEADEEVMEIIYRMASIVIRTVWLHRETRRSRMELERFSDVKKRFIGHTSHELRTPLTVVRSAVDSIEGKESDQELLSMARDAVDNLQNTVEMLLSYNDIELRSNAFDTVLVDAASIVKDCIRELARDFEENNVGMSIDNSAGRVLIMLDQSKIRLVFKSLIENALNYVEENGRVDIEMMVSADEPSVDEGIELKDCYTGIGYRTSQSVSEDGSRDDTKNSERENYFVCRIGDNGIGIPENEIRYISEPFRMASNSPLKGVKGLGMGLAISQRIIAGHGGKLFCRSGEGRGSIFSVWLPVKSPKVTE